MGNNKFKGKYKGGSRRLKGWDYSSNGLYFLTIVTQGRECNLGIIENENIVLSDFGKIVKEEWHKSFEIRRELILHEYVIMPNHIHCIVEIDTNRLGAENHLDIVESYGDIVESNGDIVESHGRAILQIPENGQIPDESIPDNNQFPENN